MGYGLHWHPWYESIDVGIKDINILAGWATSLMDHIVGIIARTFFHNGHHGKIAWIYTNNMPNNTYIGCITPSMHLLPQATPYFHPISWKLEWGVN